MGTRGVIGYIIDGNLIESYNHFDSYPDALGQSAVEQVNDMLPDLGRCISGANQALENHQ